MSSGSTRSAVTKPPFEPIFCSTKTTPSLVPLTDSGNSWTSLWTCHADFSADLFEAATSQLIHHPEYNSTLILRSETVAETDLPEDIAALGLPGLNGLVPVRDVHRRLLPRRPGRDAGLEQHCTLYAPAPSTDDVDQTPSPPCVLVLTPIEPNDGSPLPYYHPTVSHLAFRLMHGSGPSSGDSAPSLCIDVVPHPGTSLDPGARLARTCLALLETLHRYLWGAATDYRKRVAHDRIVPREEYQDMYLIMRERHKHLVNEWHESTDPLKHVFEDIGIATYLMMVWKNANDASYVTPEGKDFPESEPWRRWPRPAGGFVDLGCGNGLLTHILAAEGYAGQGIDLRARVSWEHYPPTSRAALRVLALDPTSETLSTTDLPPNAFLIGNHADELSPWVPILATRTKASGYLSIPCCAWSFDARFDRTRDLPYEEIGDEDEFVESLGLGADGSTSSSYAAYRVWLASLSVHCGWVVECDALRIPSTRNWAIVGRKRSDAAEDDVAERIDDILHNVKQRGMFKTRRPEGKAGDH